MKMKTYKSIFLVLFCFLTQLSLALGATYYVGQGVGDADTNSCATAQTDADGSRKRNISNSNSATSGVSCLSAGDTLIVKNGTYTERLDIFDKLGTSTSPIIIKAQNSQLVTVNGCCGWVVAFAFGAANGSQNVIFDGFIVDGVNCGAVCDVISVDAGATSQPTKNITVQNSEIKNASFNGILTQEVTGGNIYRNNTVHDNGGHGLYIQGNGDLIERNEIYNNRGLGIQIQSADDVTARYNISRNNGTGTGIAGGIGVSHATNRTLIYSNLIYDNTSTTPSSLYGTIVLLSSAGTKVYNNTLHGNGNGTGNYGGALFCQSPATATFQNNIIFNNNGKDIVDDPAAPCGAGLTLVTNSTTDPSFINALNKDFGLTATSSAIDAGTVISGYPFNGAKPDQGAFETWGSANGSAEVGIINASTVVINFENNVNQPLLPASGCTLPCGFTLNLHGPVTSYTRNAANQVRLGTTTAVVSGDVMTYSYATTGGLTDSVLIGNTKNQRLNALTGISITNNVGVSQTATLTQTRFRLRTLRGTETGTPWLAAENQNFSMMSPGAARVRFKIACTVSNCLGTGFELWVSENGGAYALIAANISATDIGMVGATYLGSILVSQCNACTTTQLTVDQTTAVAGSLNLTSTSVPQITLNAARETEIEYGFQVKSGLANGTTFDFRLRKEAGVVLEAYTQTPRITIANPVLFKQ